MNLPKGSQNDLPSLSSQLNPLANLLAMQSQLLTENRFPGGTPSLQDLLLRSNASTQPLQQNNRLLEGILRAQVEDQIQKQFLRSLSANYLQTLMSSNLAARVIHIIRPHSKPLFLQL